MNTNSRSLAARLEDAQAHRGRYGGIRDNRTALAGLRKLEKITAGEFVFSWTDPQQASFKHGIGNDLALDEVENATVHGFDPATVIGPVMSLVSRENSRRPR